MKRFRDKPIVPGSLSSEYKRRGCLPWKRDEPGSIFVKNRDSLNNKNDKKKGEGRVNERMRGKLDFKATAKNS